ncbi:hypothetical protein [Spongiibacter sp. UBA1325]|uniref:hypothetical protein n=1 Tax=Spongiibacter sp. UBA1325 TaxID=1947543 RepID=UPI00257CCE26|nr:hypothetical protein [Spongiibacter sp. UBA1325]
MTVVVGIDPDANKHGVAIYQDGKLVALEMLTAIEIIERHTEGARYSIEDVLVNKFVYARNRHASVSAQSKIAMQVGRVQQAQEELVRLLKHYGADVVFQRPQKGNWAKHKSMFEKVTGWTGRSNEDTRSAAYFGWLAL